MSDDREQSVTRALGCVPAGVYADAFNTLIGTWCVTHGNPDHPAWPCDEAAEVLAAPPPPQAEPDETLARALAFYAGVPSEWEMYGTAAARIVADPTVLLAALTATGTLDDVITRTAERTLRAAAERIERVTEGTYGGEHGQWDEPYLNYYGVANYLTAIAEGRVE